MLMRGWIGLLVTAATLGQEPARSADVIRDLGSAQLKTVARAADRARELDDAASRRALQKALVSIASSEEENSEFVRLQLLDALITREVRVPGDLLGPMLEQRVTANAAFILLCRQPLANERYLLQLMTGGRQNKMPRAVLGGLLAANKAPGFAAWLWQEAPLDLEITVEEAGAGATFSIPAPKRPVRQLPPEGFPDAPDYRLIFDHSNRVFSFANPPYKLSPPRPEPLVPGPNPIGFLRVSSTGGGDSVQTVWAADLPDHRWLTQMAGWSPAIATKQHLTFTNARSFRTHALELRDKFHDTKQVLRNALLASGALTTTEATRCSLAVQVTVIDQRGDRSQPLPEIPDRK